MFNHKTKQSERQLFIAKYKEGHFFDAMICSPVKYDSLACNKNSNELN